MIYLQNVFEVLRVGWAKCPAQGPSFVISSKVKNVRISSELSGTMSEIGQNWRFGCHLAVADALYRNDDYK